MPTNLYEFTTEDVEYLRHGDRRLIARLYKPKGEGPFPAVIDLHGGAWNNGDLTGTQGLDETLAKNGFVVASLEFPPCRRRVSDIADRHQLCDPLGQGACPRPEGQPGPGRQRGSVERRSPRDARGDAAERYAIRLRAAPAGSPAADATVRAVAMSWPVINPLSRYRHAQKLGKGPNPPAFTDRHEG